MRQTSGKLTNNLTLLPKTSLHPHRCFHCNRFFHEFWFASSHKKKHVDRYKKFWLKKRPYLKKKSRLDELCKKMRAQQQQSSQLRKPSGHPMSKKQYFTRSQMASKTSKKLTVQTQDALLTCKVCAETFKTEPKYQVHLQNHSEVIPSICKRCDEEPSRCICVKAHHQQQYSNDSPFRCLKCTKTFAKRPHLVLHQKTHDKEEGYSCDICHVSFSSSDILKMHKCLQRETSVICSNCSEEVKKNCAKEITLTLSKEDHTHCQYCDSKYSKTGRQLGEEQSLLDYKDNDLCRCPKKQDTAAGTSDQIKFLCHDCDKASDKVTTEEQMEVCVSAAVQATCEQTCVQKPSEDEPMEAKTRGKKMRRSSRKAFVTKDILPQGCEQSGPDGGVQGNRDEEVADLKRQKTDEQEAMDLSHKKMDSKSMASKSTLHNIKGACESSNMLSDSCDKSLGEENNNKQSTHNESENQSGALNLAITKQPLVRNLSLLKIPVVAKRGEESEHEDAGFKEESPDDEDTSSKEKHSQPDSSVKVKKQKLIHSITDKLTEAIIDDLDDPGASPLDLSKDSTTKQDLVQRSDDLSKDAEMKQDLVQSSTEKSNEAASELTSVQRTESTKIHIPIIKGTVDSAIEEELLKFYGHAITYIGLTVYREHEKELYGHNLSQVGLFNSGHGSDVMSDEQKRP